MVCIPKYTGSLAVIGAVRPLSSRTERGETIRLTVSATLVNKDLFQA